jgi:hypothetical protein
MNNKRKKKELGEEGGWKTKEKVHVSVSVRGEGSCVHLIQGKTPGRWWYQVVTMRIFLSGDHPPSAGRGRDPGTDWELGLNCVGIVRR